MPESKGKAKAPAKKKAPVKKKAAAKSPAKAEAAAKPKQAAKAETPAKPMRAAKPKEEAAPPKGVVKVTLRKSPTGYNKKQREVLRGLGLRRMHQSILRKDNSSIRGMIFKVKHLVDVEEGA